MIFLYSGTQTREKQKNKKRKKVKKAFFVWFVGMCAEPSEKEREKKIERRKGGEINRDSWGCKKKKKVERKVISEMIK